MDNGDNVLGDEPNTNDGQKDESETARKRRKGVRNSENYTRNVIRNCRVMGAEYKSYKNKVVKAKEIGLSCK